MTTGARLGLCGVVGALTAAFNVSKQYTEPQVAEEDCDSDCCLQRL